MPTKWKIFKAVNYFQFISCLVVLGLAISQFTNADNEASGYLGLLAVCVFFLSLILNSLLNLYILRKFFPDTPLPKKIIRLQNISTFFFSLVILGLLFLFISEFTDDIPNNYHRSMVITLVFLFLILVTSVFIWPVQLQLEAVLRRNSNKKIKSLINEIGE
jgi:hypothetical protein